MSALAAIAGIIKAATFVALALFWLSIREPSSLERGFSRLAYLASSVLLGLLAVTFLIRLVVQ